MPRAFLITHRRYDDEIKPRDLSPEHPIDNGETISRETRHDNSTECPDELYNLTKLAEVAVATGQIMAKNRMINNSNSIDQEETVSYTHKLFDKSSKTARLYLNKIETPARNKIDLCSSGECCSVLETLVNDDLSVNLENNVHECTDCGKKYSTSSNLARHRQTHRSPADKKARRCPYCDKIYVSMPAFSMHVRTHNQGCKCHFCGKCFSRPWLLQGHIRTHTGEKPFKCTVCNKAFADKSNLRAHVQTHSNTKPHVCRRCGKAFALKSYLYKHEESSCMRINARLNSKEALPTPVIVTVDSRNISNIIKNPTALEKVLDKTVRSPLLYRSTVISPNPERIIYSTIEHPSVLNNGNRYAKSLNYTLQEKPVDFSIVTKGYEHQPFTHNFEGPRGCPRGLAVAV